MVLLNNVLCRRWKMPKAKVNDININYKVEGQGEPLVMIMGYSGPRIGWIFQTRVFKKLYRVITFDNRGVGKTDEPEGPYTIRMMADDTIGLMDYLDIDSAHILGVSMGGMIAQELAINYPDRVKKLVLGCNSAKNVLAKDEIGGIAPELQEVMELTDPSDADVLKGFSTLLSLSSNKWYISMLMKYLIPLRVRILGGIVGLKGQAEACRTHDTLARLHMIEAPTLVITGAADRLILPSSSDVIADQIPNAKLVKVENGSHLFMVEMRGRFNQEVQDFLVSS